MDDTPRNPDPNNQPEEPSSEETMPGFDLLRGKKTQAGSPAPQPTSPSTPPAAPDGDADELDPHALTEEQWVMMEQEEDEEDEEKRRRILLLLLFLLLLLLCCLCGLAFRYWQDPQPLPELVAPDANLPYAPHYLFSIYGVDKPIGVTLSPAGDYIYVSEGGGERLVKVFNRDGSPLFSFAPPRTTAAGERAPVYLDTDSKGRVFVADRSQHAIFVYRRDGTYLDTILDPELALSDYINKHIGGIPPSISFEYTLYEDSVYYALAEGGEEQTLPGPGVPDRWSPLGIRIDENDRLYVTDVVGEEHKIREFDIPQQDLMTYWPDVNSLLYTYGSYGQEADQFLFPNVAMPDGRGRIYITDGNNSRVAVWDTQGNYQFVFAFGSGQGSLSLPRGLFIEQDDMRLYVVDAVGHHIVVYDISAESPEFLFAFGDYGRDNGLFNYPNDIYVDQTGRLYVTDRENNRVQVWSY